MLGKQQIVISSDDFIKGCSTSNYTHDGGFSPSSTNVNIHLTKGILYSCGATTDASTNLAGDIIASCANIGTGISTVRRAYLDSSANFYTLAGSTLTKQKTGSGTYTYGLSYIEPFQGSYYATTTTNVSKWNGTSTLDETWWTATVTLSGGSNKPSAMSASYPHPVLVYKNRLWIADGQYLYYYDGIHAYTPYASGGDAPGGIDLGVGQVIYALGVDPGSGQILISSMLGSDASLVTSQPKYIWLYDGFSVLPSRQIVTNDLPLSFHTVGDTVFAGIARGVGIWNGSGINIIRTFATIAYDATVFPYKGRIASIGNLLYFIDGKRIFSLGETVQTQSRGQKVYCPLYYTGNTIYHISDIGAGQIGVFMKDGSSNRLLYEIDTTAAASGGSFITNYYEFPRPATIHRIRVFTTAITNTNSGGTVGIYDNENGDTINPTQSSMTAPNGSYKSYFDFDFGGTKVLTAQFYVSLGVSGMGFKRMIIYYDIGE